MSGDYSSKEQLNEIFRFKDHPGPIAGGFTLGSVVGPMPAPGFRRGFQEELRRFSRSTSIFYLSFPVRKRMSSRSRSAEQSRRACLRRLHHSISYTGF